MNSVLKTVAAILASQLLLCSAQSQDFPSRPIRIVVPNSPGVIADVVPRVLGPEMAKVLGQPIIIENRPGANYALGLEIVAKQAPADGYTISSVNVETLATLPVTLKELRFDPGSDLPPFAGLVESKFLFGSNPKFPWKSFQEMVANAKANPGKLNYGASAPIQRLLTGMLLKDTGINVVFIPYSGGGPFIQGLLAGDIQMGFVGEGSATGFGDKFRVLAVTGDARSVRYPDVPTFKELGHPNITGISYSFNVRSGTPKTVQDKLYKATTHALSVPEVKAHMAKLSLDITNQSPEVATRILAQQIKLFSEVAAQVGIKPE